MYETLLVEKKDAIATITINRPEYGNAFAGNSYAEMRDAVEECGRDESVKVIVLTGTGKNFSAGGDIKRFKMLLEAGNGIDPKGIIVAGQMSEAVRRCPKPVIAMINGAAAGAGCSLALACDFRVMAPKSKLIMAFINMGFSGDTGGIYYLSRLIGMAKTTEMMALGTPVGADEALRLGLATRVAESEEALASTTYELAAQLAAKPGAAIALQKRLYYEFFYRDLEQFKYREADYMRQSSLTQDHAEAVNAFLEKRKPSFVGK